jgi:hypothetical protein
VFPAIDRDEVKLNDRDIVAALAFGRPRWPPLMHDKRCAAGMN